MIDVKNLTKWYGSVPAVDDISFHVEKGQIVGFLGPNGAGKSTTLKVLTCFHPPTSGTATVAGHDVLDESLQVRRKIGYMPEAVPFYPEMRVGEFLKFRASLRDLRGKQRKIAIEHVAKRCWLSEPENMMRRPIGQLSRGYKQRVGLAEVMLHNPEVLVLDEPTIGLDPAQIRAMRDLIRGLGDDHTVILSSHILAEVEQTCSRLIIIAAGKIAAEGTADELRRRVLGPSRLIVELKGADDGEFISSIKAISNVRSVEATAAGNWTRLTVQADTNADPRSEVFALASQKGWQMRELRREIGSLEDFFVQITYEQNVLAGERAVASA